MTLLASFAQEESRSISENVKWGIRKRFEKGIPNGHKASYGYEWDGEMFRIIPEQGEVVKEIYQRYLAGEPAYSIAKVLAERGVTGHMGRPIEQTTVKEILSNRSYTGTMVLQKNFFTENKVRKQNKGELPMYLVEEMYEPLVTEDDLEQAQVIRQQRADEMPNKNPVLTPFSGRVKCGNCGCGFSRRTSGKKKRWVCNTRERKGMDACECRPIDEQELIDATTKVMGDRVLDEEKFKKEVKQITIHGDCIMFSFENGRTRKVNRSYSGSRGQNAFTNKVRCGICGEKCERDNWGKKKVWCCSQPRTGCQLRRLPEPELLQAAEHILGDNFEGKVVQMIDSVRIYDDRLDFIFKDGTVKAWQRK